jgi:methylmalonyl-CoA/ethylmalonyl-CoA epimerase
MRFDHLGLVVRTLRKGRAGLAALVRADAWTAEFEDPVNGVICQFGRDRAGVVYELLQPLGPDSPVAAALTERRAILNHVAYLVDDLAAAGRQLTDEGCAPTSQPKPAVAYGGRPIQFFVTPVNFIVELIEAPLHSHVFLPASDAATKHGIPA